MINAYDIFSHARKVKTRAAAHELGYELMCTMLNANNVKGQANFHYKSVNHVIEAYYSKLNSHTHLTPYQWQSLSNVGKQAWNNLINGPKRPILGSKTPPDKQSIQLSQNRTQQQRISDRRVQFYDLKYGTDQEPSDSNGNTFHYFVTSVLITGLTFRKNFSFPK